MYMKRNRSEESYLVIWEGAEELGHGFTNPQSSTIYSIIKENSSLNFLSKAPATLFWVKFI